MAFHSYDTHAAALADLANVAAGDFVLVAMDETNRNRHTPYLVENLAAPEDPPELSLKREAFNYNGFAEFIDTGFEERDPTILARIASPTVLTPEGTKQWGDLTFGTCKTIFESPPESENPTYACVSCWWGYNLNGSGVPEDPTKPAFGIFLESPFEQQNVMAAEMQLRCYAPDAEAPDGYRQFRPFQFFLPHDFADGALRQAQFAVATLRLYDEEDNPVAIWNMHDKAFEFVDGTFLRFDNGYPVLMQRDSEGAEQPLPYLNERNELQIDQALNHNAPATLNEQSQWTHIRRVYLNAVAGGFGKAEFLQHPVAGGVWYHINFQGSVEGGLIYSSIQQHATGGLYRQDQTTGGDIVYRMKVGNVQWAFGHAASDNRLHWSPLGFLGAGDAFALDPTSLDAIFGGNAVLPAGKAVRINGKQVVGERGAFIAGPTGGATQDTQARAALGEILGLLAAHGLMEPT